MRIDASGNIGIGTSAPAAKLQVEDLTNNAEILVSAGDNPGVPNSPSLSLMRKDGYDVQLATYGLKLDAADGNKFKLLYGGAGGFTATPLVVDTSGNVGIGTSAPPHRLTVSGGFIAIDNGSQLIGGGVGNTFYYRLIGNDSANRIILGDTSSSVATEIRFHTNGSLTPAMLVNTAGNVGIGVTSSFPMAPCRRPPVPPATALSPRRTRRATRQWPQWHRLASPTFASLRAKQRR
jgi:hypothetical protein